MIIRAGREHLKWIVRHRVEMFRSMGWNEVDLAVTKKVTSEFLEKEWDMTHPEVFLKVLDDIVVGGCAIEYYTVLPDSRNPSGKCGYVLNMYVEPDHRGKGIATELLRHIIALSSKRGVHKIALHDTDMSRRIYEKEGFEISKNFFQLHLN